jgi:hypothetical protein
MELDQACHGADHGAQRLSWSRVPSLLAEVTDVRPSFVSLMSKTGACRAVLA